MCNAIRTIASTALEPSPEYKLHKWYGRSTETNGSEEIYILTWEYAGDKGNESHGRAKDKESNKNQCVVYAARGVMNSIICRDCESAVRRTRSRFASRPGNFEDDGNTTSSVRTKLRFTARASWQIRVAFRIRKSCWSRAIIARLPDFPCLPA